MLLFVCVVLFWVCACIVLFRCLLNLVGDCLLCCWLRVFFNVRVCLGLACVCVRVFIVLCVCLCGRVVCVCVCGYVCLNVFVLGCVYIYICMCVVG